MNKLPNLIKLYIPNFFSRKPEKYLKKHSRHKKPLPRFYVMACLRIKHWQEYYATICIRTELFLKATESIIELIHKMVKRINNRNSINLSRHKTEETTVDDTQQIEEIMEEKPCQCNEVFESIEESLEEIRIRTSNLMTDKPLLAGYILRAIREDIHLLIDRLEKTDFKSPTDIFSMCPGTKEHKFTHGLKKKRRR